MTSTTTLLSLVLVIIVISTTATSILDASLIHSYLSDPIDNRPEGRYRFSMICFQWAEDYYGYVEPAVGILGGTSTVDDYSADFHLYLPDSDRWYEQSDNRVSYDPRHSMFTQPVYTYDYIDAELLSIGGFQHDASLGTTIVESSLLKLMAPQDPEYPEDMSWAEPWTDDWSGTPGARARGASFSIGANMYVFGGITGDGVIKGDLWKFTAYDGWYAWEAMYSPAEIDVFGSSYYYYDTGSYDDYGGGSFTDYYAPDYGSYYSDSYYSDSYSSDSYYYSSSSSYYGSSSSSSSASTTGRDAAVMEVADQQHQHQQQVYYPHQRGQHAEDLDDNELVFFEKAYETEYKRRSRHHNLNHHQNQQTQQHDPDNLLLDDKNNNNNENTLAYRRAAEAQSYYGFGSVEDSELFRYGACCAALGPADGPDASSTGSGTEQYALCFGGTGNTGDYRSVIKYKNGDYQWELLNVTNPNDGPKPVRDAACTYNHVEQKFIVFGGYDSRTGSATTDTRIYYLNISNLEFTGEATWNHTDPIPNFTPVYGHAMCTTPMNSKTYLYGGKSTFTTNATLFELEWIGGAANASIKQATAPLVKLPGERAYHIAAAAGTAFYIGFGRKKDKMLSDFWKYDLITDSWSTITQANIPVRWGSSAAVFGGTIFLFGGRSSLTGTTCYADLIAYEPAKEFFSVVDATDNAPSARAFHVSFSSGGSVVVGLGQDNNGELLDDWFAFSPVTQTWRQLIIVGDTISPRVGAATVQSYNETHSIVGLGYSDVGLNDWYFVQVDSEMLISTRIAIDSTALEPRVTRRSFASVSGRGRHILVCGGMQTSQLAAPPDARCYQVDAATGQIGLTGSNMTAPVGLVAAPAVYVKDSIFTFGGQVINDPTVSDVFFKRMIRVRPNMTCNSSATNSIPDDTDCVLCGFGSSGLGCSFTDPGYYTTIQGQTLPCPEGTFSTIRGGASASVCVPCPFGTFGNETGLSKCYSCGSGTYCPVGSSLQAINTTSRAALLTSSLPISGVLKEDNPGAYQTPPLPWFPVGIVGGFAIFIALLVTMVLLINLKFYNRRLHYYFPTHIEAKLERIFISFATNGREMTLAQLVLVFNALKMEISPSLLEKAFEDQVEDTGRLNLTQRDFKKLWMDLIRVGVLPPFENSDAAREGIEPSFFLASLGGIKLSGFDSFRNEHMPPELGEPRRVIQTWYGGVFTLFLFVAQIVIILAILVDFLYSNVTETKAIVPYPVIQAAFGDSIGDVKSDFTARIGITGPIRTSNRYDPSDDPITKAEKVCLDYDTRACNNETKVSVTGVTIPRPEDTSFSCEFDRTTRQCFVTWKCPNCTVVASAELTYTFSSAQSANRIDCRVSTTTGIRKPWQDWTGELKIAAGEMMSSTIEEAVSPTTSFLVFSGFPATQFHLGLSPTYFESVELVQIIVPSENPVLQSGYHLRPDGNPTKGNSITPEFFGTYYDAPVKISLKTDAEIMYVRRQFVQSLIDLISSLLGAVSGVAGVFLAATNFLDERQDNPISIDENGEEVEQDKDEVEEAKKNREGKIRRLRERQRKEKEGIPLDESDKEPSDNDEDSGKLTLSKRRKVMKLPGQEDGDFNLMEEASLSATDADTRRVLPLVSLGMSVDLALKYQQVMRTSNEEIPPAALEDYDLESYKKQVEQKKHLNFDDVEEVMVDEDKIEQEKKTIHGESKYQQLDENNNNNTSQQQQGDGDYYMTPQVVHVESARPTDRV